MTFFMNTTGRLNNVCKKQTSVAAEQEGNKATLKAGSARIIYGSLCVLHCLPMMYAVEHNEEILFFVVELFDSR
jgi:hypothetical protein